MNIATGFQRSVIAALAALLIGGGAFAQGNAGKQTSLDSRIFEAFDRIDDRTNTHEQNVTAMRARLDRLSAEMETLRERFNALPGDGDDADLRRRRRLLRGRMINLSAEYLNQSYKILDSAAAVVSANLSDLAKLAAEVRRSGDRTGGALKLQNRIQRNIGAGRSMRDALVRLRAWARQDPSMTDRFRSLKRITAALDRRVSIDKARLKGSYTDPTGAVRDRRLEALDHTVDRLGDMYAEIAGEKDALRDLRDELAIAIQLGRLEMTQEVADRAIPRVDDLKGPSTGATSLESMATVISDLNSAMVQEAELPADRAAPASASEDEADLRIGGFSNF